MPLSDQDIALIQDSFATLQRALEPNSLFFYEALFHHAPQFRRLFREDLAGQGMKFMSTLSVIVKNLKDPSLLESRYAELGRTHAIMGVRAPDFAPMEEALVDTMRHALGPRFTPEHERAWRMAFGAFSKAMIEKGEIPAK